jgi:endoglucanase
MLVTDVKEGGFLSVTSVGGLDLRTLPSARVRVYGKQTLDGVISSVPPHLSKGDNELPAVEDLLIDTGYPVEELRELAPVGTPVGFLPTYRDVGPYQLSGKGLVNKACAAVAVEGILSVPKEHLAGDVHLLLSVHEETDKQGGTAVGGFALRPDYAMVIDVNLGVMRGADKWETVAMGKGPSIARSAIVHGALTEMTVALCRREALPFQICVAPQSTGTNTEALHLVGTGIPVVDVGLPLTSMHTYVESLDMRDAETLSRLVALFVQDKNVAEVFLK